MPAAPSLSVIVVCKNPGARLHAALESVWGQRSVDLEVIVVDCGSTDGTAAWLEANRARLAHLRIAPNTSVYGGMNEGVSFAHGEWIFFLGARDRLVGDMVLSESLNWMRKTEAGVVAGESATDNGRLDKLRSQANPVARNFVPRSAAFYRRALFEENGHFDTTLAVMADYEFNVRLWKGRVRFKPMPLRIAACDATATYDRKSCAEEIHVRHRYFGVWRSTWWDVLSLLRWSAARSGQARSRSQ